MKLRDEIQTLLASYSTPDEAAAVISEEMARIDHNREAPGIAVGERAPDFRLPNSVGEEVWLEERLRRGPVVVSFFRGAWCPVCNLQLRALHRALPELREAGGSLVGIHPDMALFGNVEVSPDFDMVCDPKQSVIHDYRLQFTVPARVRQIYTSAFNTDISSYNADGSWRLPVPGTFVIDQDGIVRRRHVTADFTRRMEPEEVIEALEELRGQVA
ncbi:MAG: peroxiredoxin-like family protein [Bryobacterales bacterium]